ncbi:MAG: hypothetical protein ACFE0O_04685 [Opitutales bacterium]
MASDSQTRERPPPDRVDDLRATDVFRTYDQAFRLTTGLALQLVAPDQVDPLQERPEDPENPFCRLVNRSGFSCDLCRRLTLDLAADAGLPVRQVDGSAAPPPATGRWFSCCVPLRCTWARSATGC